MKRAGTGCRKVGCAGVVRAGVCSVCGPQKRGGHQEYDEGRGSAAERGYGYRWQRLRQAYLRVHPLCVVCQAEGRVVAATDVDHIIAKRDGGTDDELNLQPLCHSHHSRKTMTEYGQRSGLTPVR